jgi:hypothetical protein
MRNLAEQEPLARDLQAVMPQLRHRMAVAVAELEQ